MAYQEYFDYSDCSDTVNYSNYEDVCEVSYYNYSDCETSYTDEPFDCYEYYNYNDCETSYSNYEDSCETYTDYSNHVDYTNPNTGASFTFGNNTPDGTSTTSWGSDWNVDTLTSTYIAESISALKELRDKAQVLSEEKGQQLTDTSGLSTTDGPVDDDEFDDGDPGTPEYVEDKQYDAIRDNLENLWNNLTTDSYGITTKDRGDIIDKNSIESIKSKIDDLAEKDLTADYSNYANTNGTVEVDYSEYTTDNYADHSDYSDHSYTRTYG